MRISLLVHGYPPHEHAGTEQHTAMLATSFEKKGHIVQVINATRSAVHQHGICISKGEHHRIVNNIPARPLQSCEKDSIIGDRIERLWASFEPDIIHIQHIQFLSIDLTFPCPALMTLHDAWLWCAAGGKEREYNNVCSGAEPQKCASCATHWSPILPKRGQFLIKSAQKLNKFIPVSMLNRAWKTLPITLRHQFSHSAQSKKSPHFSFAQQRNQAMKDFSNKFSYLLSPSQYLAQRAQKHDISSVQVLRHGVRGHKKHIGGQGFVFIGTIAEHKGPQIVYQAYKNSTEQHLPLRFYGSLQEPGLIPQALWKGIVSQQEILDILQHADALVMGSIWPENAPLVIIEAHSVGCPVIAPNIGGIPEIIQEGIDGLLYEAGNEQELSRLFSDIITLPSFETRPPLLSTVVEEHLTRYEKLL